jgi:hypothetical protein
MGRLRAVPSHYLRTNASEWTPRRVLCFDTETLPEAQGARELHRLRCWAARLVIRRPGRGETGAISATGFDRRSLADFFDRVAARDEATWVYAHNLDFDLTTSAVIDYLWHYHRWELTGWHFAGRSVSGQMRQDRRHLGFYDLHSILPESLERIGARMGFPKGRMPPWEAPDEVWERYCARDVEVTAAAVCQLMDWWDEHRLGRWTGTGPGLGWNCLRHRLERPPGYDEPDDDGIVDDPPKKSRRSPIVIKTDQAGIDADRVAVYGGRRDLTRVGQLAGGPFAQLDFRSAYLTAARHYLLPRQRGVWYPRFDLDGWQFSAPDLGVIAECEVSTDEARYPLRARGQIFYPVGRFRTVLCRPEIELAASRGELESIGGGWTHKLGFWARSWAEWVAGLLEGAEGDQPPLVEPMAKAWSRSVLARFAMHTTTAVHAGPALHPTWYCQRGSDGPRGVRFTECHVAGERWHYYEDQDADDAYPAVLAWVQCHVRLALGRMLDALGEDVWVLCDTDGAWVDCSRLAGWTGGGRSSRSRLEAAADVARNACTRLEGLCAPFVPRLKELSEGLRLIGPQHYATDRAEVMAGRPKRTDVDADGAEHRWLWPGVSWQMAHGSREGFVRVEGTWPVPTHLAHRWELADGRCLPPFAVSPRRGPSDIAPWDPGRLPDGGAELADGQSRPFAGLY